MTYLISTDLDGTLLDHHDYSWTAAKPAIRVCAEQGIPIIFNTSKTATEARALQTKIGIEGPAIVENGSALILPSENSPVSDYQYSDTMLPRRKLQDGGPELVFGVERSELIEFIKRCRRQNSWLLEGFNDWSVAQISSNTGLGEEDAAMASKKAYSEPFLWKDTAQSFTEFSRLAIAGGYRILKGGRFFHLQGDTNKAVPLIWLKDRFRHNYRAKQANPVDPHGNEEVKLICLGDNHNDVDMLNIADIPICVRSPVAGFPALQTQQKIVYTDGEGPVGWNESVLKILNSNHG